MTAAEIRREFIDYFEKRGHTSVPSAPVVPLDDPTLLFANAGMNQFKDVFLGIGHRDYTRAVNSQKCIRVSGKHNDLEEVGKDTYHHTFFEMLGNWSFGDYYKKGAIQFGWELLTEVWGLPKDALWATVYTDDDEADELWRQVTDIGRDRILRFGKKDNFWEMGETGPCGPCSEIHIDLGDERCDKKHVEGHVCEVNIGCARYIELWNLVFIQYDRAADGSLTELPDKHVDTGMGLERLAAVLQNKVSNYDTDLFMPIIEAIADLTGINYAEADEPAAFRVIADHIRSLTFAITDGALPSNEGRGYVLRRLLRRAARFGRKLEMHQPFIYKLVPAVVDLMGDAFPEVKNRADHVSAVLKYEEASFGLTLDRGLEIFEETAAALKERGGTSIPGADAFRLYDTYGFPVDLTQLMAEERGLEVDEPGFNQEMEQQRQRSRDDRKKTEVAETQAEAEWETLSEGSDSAFCGYETLERQTEIRKVHRQEGKAYLVLAETPFYAESGGQVGDVGSLVGTSFEAQVVDTRRQDDMILHVLEESGVPESPETAVTAVVDGGRRQDTANNHTATHLLHGALRETLGSHVQQSGSLVCPDYLRFDFTHFDRPTSEQLEEVERIVNEKIRANLPVETYETSLDDAKREGIIALFGEKYGEMVRVVRVGDYSRELCGGTHVSRTGDIGYFRVTSEASIAAGIRRIEAATGRGCDELLRKEKRLAQDVVKLLNCQEEQVAERITGMLEERKQLEKRLAKALQGGAAAAGAGSLVAEATDVGGVKVVARKVDAGDANELKAVADSVRSSVGSGVAVLGADVNGKASFVCMVTDDLIRDKGLKAGDIVREVAKSIGGSGGGKPHMATAGAKDGARVDEALAKVGEVIAALLS